jgi:copper(I)-binding protein
MRASAFFIAGFLGLALLTAQARDYKVGSIEVVDPWSRATPKGASVAAGYMKITNNGSTADRLIGGSSEIAPTFEIHEMSMEGGIARMRPVKGGLEIKPGETVELKPGSFHVMLVGLKKPLAAGEHVSAKLVFEKAGPVEVQYDVMAIGAAPGRDMPAMPMPGMEMPAMPPGMPKPQMPPGMPMPEMPPGMPMPGMPMPGR